jgi:phosphopantothenate synthetase
MLCHVFKLLTISILCRFEELVLSDCGQVAYGRGRNYDKLIFIKSKPNLEAVYVLGS